MLHELNGNLFFNQSYQSASVYYSNRNKTIALYVYMFLLINTLTKAKTKIIKVPMFVIKILNKAKIKYKAIIKHYYIYVYDFVLIFVTSQ